MIENQKENKKKRGRPTAYRPEFCEMLIEHMAQGFSFTSFAAKINVNQDTLYNFLKAQKDFDEAKKLGENLSLMKWEKIGIDQAEGNNRGNAASYIFNMKNRFAKLGWTDKVEVDQKIDIEIKLKKDDLKLLNEANAIDVDHELIKSFESLEESF